MRIICLMLLATLGLLGGHALSSDDEASEKKIKLVYTMEDVDRAYREGIEPELSPGLRAYAEEHGLTLQQKAALGEIVVKYINPPPPPPTTDRERIRQALEEPYLPSDMFYPRYSMTMTEQEFAETVDLWKAAKDSERWRIRLTHYVTNWWHNHYTPELVVDVIEEVEQWSDSEERWKVLASISHREKVRNDPQFAEARQYYIEARLRCAYEPGVHPAGFIYDARLGYEVSIYTIYNSYLQASERLQEATITYIEDVLEREVDPDNREEFLDAIREARDIPYEPR